MMGAWLQFAYASKATFLCFIARFFFHPRILLSPFYQEDDVHMVLQGVEDWPVRIADRWRDNRLHGALRCTT